MVAQISDKSFAAVHRVGPRFDVLNQDIFLVRHLVASRYYVRAHAQRLSPHPRQLLLLDQRHVRRIELGNHRVDVRPPQEVRAVNGTLDQFVQGARLRCDIQARLPDHVVVEALALPRVPHHHASLRAGRRKRRNLTDNSAQDVLVPGEVHVRRQENLASVPRPPLKVGVQSYRSVLLLFLLAPWAA